MFTDPLKIRANDPGHPKPSAENPTGCVVFALHQIYEPSKEKNQEREKGCRDGSLGCAQCKKELLEGMNTAMGPQRARRDSLSQKKGLVNSLLEEGGRRAQEAALQTLQEVKQAIGFA